MRRKTILPILALLLIATTIGCAPDDREKNYHTAAQAVNDFAIAFDGVVNTEISLHNQGFVANDEHLKLLDLFEKVKNAAVRMNNALLTTYSQPGAISALNESLNATSDLLAAGVAPLKNAQAKATLQVALSAARSVLVTISIVLNQPLPATKPANTGGSGMIIIKSGDNWQAGWFPIKTVCADFKPCVPVTVSP